jgi:hypothetical protein
MALDGTALVWSPRSDILLYGDTAQAPVTERLGVLLALGTNWTASGSMNVLRELRCADEFNRTYYDRFFTDEQLWLMATYNAAQATATDDVIGQLRTGLVADITIFDDRDRTGTRRIDHRAILAADPEDVVLVLRGGRALYGDNSILSLLPGTTACNALDVCGTQKSVCPMRRTTARACSTPCAPSTTAPRPTPTTTARAIPATSALLTPTPRIAAPQVPTNPASDGAQGLRPWPPPRRDLPFLP